MVIQLKNNADGVLASGVTSVATTLSLQTGEGVRFPVITGSDYFYVTLINASLQIEVVKVTARVSDTFTIVRAQDNTTALVFVAGDTVTQRWNVKTIEDLINDKIVFTNPSIVTKTADYTILSSDHTILADATSNVITLTLPVASTVSGKIIAVKKIDSSVNIVTVVPQGAETIDSDTSLIISAFPISITFQSDGSNWFII